MASFDESPDADSGGLSSPTTPTDLRHALAALVEACQAPGARVDPDTLEAAQLVLSLAPEPADSPEAGSEGDDARLDQAETELHSSPPSDSDHASPAEGGSAAPDEDSKDEDEADHSMDGGSQGVREGGGGSGSASDVGLGPDDDSSSSDSLPPAPPTPGNPDDVDEDSMGLLEEGDVPPLFAMPHPAHTPCALFDLQAPGHAVALRAYVGVPMRGKGGAVRTALERTALFRASGRLHTAVVRGQDPNRDEDAWEMVLPAVTTGEGARRVELATAAACDAEARDAELLRARAAVERAGSAVLVEAGHDRFAAFALTWEVTTVCGRADLATRPARWLPVVVAVPRVVVVVSRYPCFALHAAAAAEAAKCWQDGLTEAVQRLCQDACPPMVSVGGHMCEAVPPQSRAHQAATSSQRKSVSSRMFGWFGRRQSKGGDDAAAAGGSGHDLVRSTAATAADAERAEVEAAAAYVTDPSRVFFCGPASAAGRLAPGAAAVVPHPIEEFVPVLSSTPEAVALAGLVGGYAPPSSAEALARSLVHGGTVPSFGGVFGVIPPSPSAGATATRLAIAASAGDVEGVPAPFQGVPSFEAARRSAAALFAETCPWWHERTARACGLIPDTALPLPMGFWVEDAAAATLSAVAARDAAAAAAALRQAIPEDWETQAGQPSGAGRGADSVAAQTARDPLRDPGPRGHVAQGSAASEPALPAHGVDSLAEAPSSDALAAANRAVETAAATTEAAARLLHARSLRTARGGTTLDSSEALGAVRAWALPPLLSLVHTTHLLMVLGALMGEYKVVVRAGRLPIEAASAAVVGLAALLRPLRWVSTLVPLLPAKLHRVLEASVPVLCGVQELPPNFKQDDRTVLLHLDRDDVSVPEVLRSGGTLYRAYLEVQLPLSSELSKALDGPCSVLHKAGGLEPPRAGDPQGDIARGLLPLWEANEDQRQACMAVAAVMEVYVCGVILGRVMRTEGVRVRGDDDKGVLARLGERRSSPGDAAAAPGSQAGTSDDIPFAYASTDSSEEEEEEEEDDDDEEGEEQEQEEEQGQGEQHKGEEAREEGLGEEHSPDAEGALRQRGPFWRAASPPRA
ncbi:hypothetical protein FNF28_02937 [Cafeteria roenbergensis]|uniref:cDENN domain-containing protein n=1 Tax=Cafeteria roenbergensis TaxID=33653 RepID=A0A5A8DQH3_CAFRO|nr:hypothetical protein FNF28_02937 [Cafeteria roenbergensis]